MSVERASNRRRRGAATVAVALVCLGPLAAGATPPAAADPARPPTVSVEGRSAVRDVLGHFDVPVPLSVAWSVLTDYDHIADFVGSMRASAVESRGDGELTVRQEAVAGVFPFRRVARLLLRVREHPRRPGAQRVQAPRDEALELPLDADLGHAPRSRRRRQRGDRQCRRRRQAGRRNAAPVRGRDCDPGSPGASAIDECRDDRQRRARHDGRPADARGCPRCPRPDKTLPHGPVRPPGYA